MKKNQILTAVLFVLISIGCVVNSYAQKTKFWNSLPSNSVENITPLKGFQWQEVNIISIPRSTLFNNFREVPKETATFRSQNSNFILSLPLTMGEVKDFRLVETALLTPESAAEFPFIKTYLGTDIENPKNTLHLTLSHLGINAMMLVGNETYYIKPYELNGSDEHLVFNRNAEIIPKGVSCGVSDKDLKLDLNEIEKGFRGVSDCQLRTYRVVVAATGEYTTWAGSQANAAAQITTTINNVKAIYQRDATITFTLTINNSLLYTNAATDPFTITGGTSSTTLQQSHDAIVAAVGSANFDLGHVFSNDWDGGLASSPSICSSSSKGKAQSGLSTATFSSGPSGSIMEGTVAHEMAHQFNVSHTMSSNAGGCSGNVSLATAVETGGGSTLMAYASVCTGNSYQTNSDNYFHTTSITQMTSYAISQNTCGTITSASNTAPVLTATAASYTIPVSTPFLLEATGSDVNGDAITYTFEQTNPAAAASTSNPSSTSTTGPLFRSYPPNSNNFRYFPPLANVIAGTTPTFEVLPSVARTMNFRAVARDNRSGAGCSSEVSWTITTSGTTPFRVSSQNSASSFAANGSNTFTITWDVSGTNAAPINCANVKITFSTDGGATFPNVLLSSTTNDGTETITVPNLPTTAGRIKIEGVGNIFFDVNDANITITSSCAAEASTVTPTTSVTATAGAAALNLGLSPQYGSTIASYTANVPTGTPTMPLTFNQNSTGCAAPYSNSPAYTSLTFQVGASGNYTFTLNSASSTIMNLYQNSFNSANTCANWLGSSASGNVTTTTTLTASLNKGITYVLVTSGFSTGHAAFTRTISFTLPVGGSIVTGGTPNPGASYNYAYVVVNSSTNSVRAIQSNSNLTNSTTFPAGNYNVYGLSYLNTTSLATLQSTYVNGTLTNLQNAILNSTLCGDLSNNNVSVTINCATLPNISISNNNGLNIGCSPTSTTLTANGGTSYVWSTSAATAAITVSSGGIYQVTGTDAGGCKNTASVTINYSTAAVSASISSNNGLALSCAVPTTTLTASGGDTYSWTGATTGATKVVSTAGTFSVTATSAFGCTGTASVTTYIENANGATIAPTTAVSAPMNSPSLDLTLAPVYASAITVPITNTLTSAAPSSSGAFVNITVPNCFSANSVRYQTYTFQVNVAGTYTFNKGNNNLVISLYNGSYNSANVCANFINSGSVYNGASVSIGSSVSATLNTNTTYVLLVSSFSSSSPTLPISYSVSVTGPANGAIYNTGTISPGASYNYTYVMVNNANNTIAAINSSSDLSGINVAGTYNVYGLSYHNSISNATLNAYIGTAFSSLQTNIANNTFCGSLSTNNVAVTITSTSPKLAAKAFFHQVDANTLLMDRYVSTIGNFPLSDPYAAAPYNSSFVHVNNPTVATTTPTVLAVSTNNAIVDWVFLELRQGTSGSTSVSYTKSALLQKDGDVVDMDGVSPVTFNNAPSGSYYVAIRHRNHLGFRTTNTLSLNSTATSINFTNNSAALFGSYPLVSLNGSTSAMNGGDANSDGSIDAFDTILWEAQNGLFDDYTNRSDYNMDGSVDAFDSILWEMNNGKFQELD